MFPLCQFTYFRRVTIYVVFAISHTSFVLFLFRPYSLLKDPSIVDIIYNSLSIQLLFLFSLVNSVSIFVYDLCLGVRKTCLLFGSFHRFLECGTISWIRNKTLFTHHLFSKYTPLYTSLKTYKWTPSCLLICSDLCLLFIVGFPSVWKRHFPGCHL